MDDKRTNFKAYNILRTNLGSSESKEIKRTNFKADFNYLMEKQDGKCAYPKCKKLHGMILKVDSIRDLDHKIPVKLWELMKKQGNVNMRSNLQLLCPGCHRHKTAEDKKKIALYKQSQGIKTSSEEGGLLGGGNLFGPPRKRSKNNLVGL